ncbi:DNA-directed RNA polymerase II subunit RPB1 [Dissostichus eleginoides]|uniref:DNA-directed RNA polymerase II subunit RPB1 n=1 Tax=Dissostichus eleginoides TaxID=100907 RepID=A0AAD9B7I5_DISEL|nr:DNA-directed RNA polymerase II subunit RPB1 [Dissostichus eleginoides]
MKACDWLLPMGGVASVCLPASWAGPRFSRKPEKLGVVSVGVAARLAGETTFELHSEARLYTPLDRNDLSPPSVNLSHPLSEPVSPLHEPVSPLSDLSQPLSEPVSPHQCNLSHPISVTCLTPSVNLSQPLSEPVSPPQ